MDGGRARFERFKLEGPVTTIEPSAHEIALLEAFDAEEKGKEEFDRMAYLIQYGEPMEITDGLKNRYAALLETGQDNFVHLPEREEKPALAPGSYGSQPGLTSPLPPSLSELSDELVARLKAAVSDPEADAGSVAAEVLQEHYDGLPAPAPLDCIRLLLPHVSDVKPILTPEALTVVSNLCSASSPSAAARSSRQMVPLLLALPAPSNFESYVRNLPYATASSDELKSMFQDGLSRLSTVPLGPSDRSDAISGCAQFGEELLNLSRSNVPYVRENILTNPLVSTISGEPDTPVSLPLLLLDLRCASYKGEIEHSLNLLNSLDEPDRTEELYTYALSALTRSLKYDSYLIAGDVRLVTYYAKMSRELVEMVVEDLGFRTFGPEVWRGVLMAVGAIGDWDTVKALVKAREIGVRDLLNAEVGEAVREVRVGQEALRLGVPSTSF